MSNWRRGGNFNSMTYDQAVRRSVFVTFARNAAERRLTLFLVATYTLSVVSRHRSALASRPSLTSGR